MTISAASPTAIQIPGNGTATVFAAPMKCFQASDVRVGFIATGGPYQLQTGGFAITNIDSNDGFSVIFTVAPPTGTLVDIRTVTPLTQSTEFANFGAYLPENTTEAFDRLTRELQDVYRQVYQFGIHGPDTEATPWPTLPSAPSRAGLFLSFDTNGLPIVSQFATSGTPISQSLIGQLLYPQTAGEIEASATPVFYFYEAGNVLRMGADPTGVADAAPPIQNSLNACLFDEIDCFAPGGLYTLVSAGLIQNLADQVGYRGRALRFYGSGAGPAFVTPAAPVVGNTVIQSNTDLTLWRMQQYLSSGTTSGNFTVDHIRFQQLLSTATSPVIQIDVIGEFSAFEHNEVYQSGTGDGVRCLMGTKASIQYNNILNRDWPTAGLGSARVGCGINIFSQYNAGLLTVRKNTVRGFLDGIVNGDGSHDLSAVSITENECSVCYRGITDSATNSKTKINGNYFEGIEFKCIIMLGRFTVVRDNILQTATWSLGIDASNTGGGCLIDGNEIGLPAGQSNVTGCTANGSITSPITVSNNQFIWGSSGTGLSNVVGLALTGVDPLITHFGNAFFPNAGWAGASNCQAFADNSTSSSGSSGDGTIGLGLGIDQTTSFPRLARGAMGWWTNPTAVTNTALSSGVLTLGMATSVTLTFGSAANITSLNPAVCEEDHVYSIRCTNANPTFKGGVANLKLAGNADFTPPSAGGTITFKMRNNTAYEIARTVYA
jgi:hypothetical protein